MIACASCGSVKNTPTDAGQDDAPTDSPNDSEGPPCDLTKPFGAAVVVPNLHNAVFNDTHATLSADERTVFFASDRDGNGMQTFHIYSATRSSADVPFGAPSLVGSLFSNQGESHPSVSPDGNTIFFDSFRVTQGTVHIFTSTRANVAVDFQTPTQITGDFLIDPAITTDGSVLYAANLSTGRLSRMDKVGNGFGAPQNAAIPGSFSICSPVTNDDLTIFLGLGDTVGGEIVATQRATTADVFPEPTQVTELKTSATVAEPSWLSPDGCRLYLTYGDSGGKTTIHIATRPK